MRRIGLALLALVAVAGLLWWGYGRVTTAAWRPALSSREIATRVLGESLATACPGAKALVVGNPFTLRGGQGAEVYAFEKAGLRGLREGFGKEDAIKVVYPELRQDFLQHPDLVFIDHNTTTPLSYLVAEDSFERLAQTNPGFELLVSLIGLPVKLCQGPLWRETEKLRFGLLLPDWRLVGGSEAVREAVKSGKITAAVVARPGVPPDDTPVRGADYQAEFNQRFLLVTKANIDELLRTYPRAF
jgi:hypothetical protein